MCVKKFIFSKFAGLQAYSRQLYYQMNSFTGIFRQHFKPPMLPPCIDLSPPPSRQILKSPSSPMFSTPVGNPVYGKRWLTVLIFCIQLNINGSYKFVVSISLVAVRHVWTCTKCSVITNCQYLGKELSDY